MATYNITICVNLIKDDEKSNFIDVSACLIRPADVVTNNSTGSNDPTFFDYRDLGAYEAFRVQQEWLRLLSSTNMHDALISMHVERRP